MESSVLLVDLQGNSRPLGICICAEDGLPEAMPWKQGEVLDCALSFLGEMGQFPCVLLLASGGNSQHFCVRVEDGFLGTMPSKEGEVHVCDLRSQGEVIGKELGSGRLPIPLSGDSCPLDACVCVKNLYEEGLHD